ncbi:YkgJ family cysteine cluster protein [Deinococcus radiophilus]|uniref:YkgJ family cysteine cluster protein n=1 Tax=Deinococcus radiophilus TaxID=32062 RepID=UPI00360A4D4C
MQQAYANYGQAASRWMDEFFAEGGRIFCGAGCFGCCNMPIRLSLAEALVVRDALSAEKLAAVEAHARQVIGNARMAPDDDTYVRRHRLEVGYCPLLDRTTGQCSEYAARPTRCRDTFSAFPARYCEEGHWESLSTREKRQYARDVARTPGTDGELHYVAPLEYLSEPVWDTAAEMMSQAFGVQVWGDFWVLVTLSARADFMAAIELGDAKAAWGAAKRAGLAHPMILEIE